MKFTSMRDTTQLNPHHLCCVRCGHRITMIYVSRFVKRVFHPSREYRKIHKFISADENERIC